MDLNDLPDEMLCMIFDKLDVQELKQASLVCRRWSELTFSGRRMDRVVLVPQCDNPNDFLQSSKRSHRNVALWANFPIDQLDSLLRLLHTIKLHVRELGIGCAVTWEQVGSILLNAPKLQNLKMNYNIFQEYRENNTPSRVLPKLKSLNRRQLLRFLRTNIPNLQSLSMKCSTHLELEAWKYFSGQLKLVHVNSFSISFLELTFPLVEDLSFAVFPLFWHEMFRKMSSSLGIDFFRRHPLLRRLSISMQIPVEWVESITRHCPELTYLHLVLNNPNEAMDLESLVQLTKLKHLSLDGNVDRKIFRGPMKSLDSVELEVPYPRVLLENLFEVVPRLSCLRIAEDISGAELQFICEKFSYLRSLELIISSDEFLSVADDSVRFNELIHLQELTLSGKLKIRSIHRNNVRCLTMFENEIPDDELYLIPEKFPLLKRLFLDDDRWVSVADVEWLHRLMPSCRIDYDYGSKCFYPIDDGTTN